MDVGTSCDELHGVLGKFEEGSFTRNHSVKEVNGVSDDGKGEFMSISLGNKFSSFGFSDGGDLSEGRSGVDDIFFTVSKINSSFVKRTWTGVEMFGSSFERFVSVFDFLSSENFFIFTVSRLDSPHSIMFSLFSSDLLVEFFNDSKDGGKWSTGGDHGLDFSKHTGVGDRSHGFESLVSDRHRGGSKEAYE